MTDSVECLVVGAGVVGIAVGRQLALSGLEVFVVDAEDQIGTHTSSRNSEVIHAGIYYPTGSLKARHCVDGRQALYAYCERKHVPYLRIGKIIVATQDVDRPALERIHAQGLANGVSDLEWISGDRVRELEPEVTAVAGILSPSTGIIDSHGLMVAMQADLEAAGGAVLLHSRLDSAEVRDDGFTVALDDGAAEVQCRYLINSGGLWAPDFARRIAGFDPAQVPQQHLSKAHYYAYSGRSPFSRLVYPIPANGGLGVHVTNDLSGQARFGPDARWVDDLDYAFDDSRRGEFIDAIASYYPGVDVDRLQPSYTGFRPKLSGPGEPAADFVIQGPAEHGVKGLVNLFGIESPGLTSSLAIAAHVAAALNK